MMRTQMTMAALVGLWKPATSTAWLEHDILKIASSMNGKGCVKRRTAKAAEVFDCPTGWPIRSLSPMATRSVRTTPET